MTPDRFAKLLAFLERLDKARIHYEIRNYREEAISIIARAPGEYWEIDFLADGDIDVERYRSDGMIHEESILDELFALCSDDEPSATAATQDAPSTRS